MWVFGMLRHAWDTQPFSVPSHMQSGSSAPAMYLYNKRVCFMHGYLCNSFYGWSKIVYVIHKCAFRMRASKMHMQAFTTTQAEAVSNDQLCTQWQQSHFVSQAHSISHSVSVPPYLTWCLYLSHKLILYLNRASRVYQLWLLPCQNKIKQSSRTE